MSNTNPPTHTDSPYDAPTHNTIEHSEPPVGGAFGLNDEKLPYRFRFSTFKIYEPYISNAVRSRSDVEINPAPLRATTFAARLRDALIAKRRFSWPASFTLTDLDDADLVVRHGEHTVVIGPRSLYKQRGRTIGQQLALTNPNASRLGGIIVDKDITHMQLMAFVLLLHSRLIAGPIVFKAKVSWDTTPASLNDIEEKFDVAIMPRNDKGELILL